MEEGEVEGLEGARGSPGAEAGDYFGGAGWGI